MNDPLTDTSRADYVQGTATTRAFEQAAIATQAGVGRAGPAVLERVTEGRVQGVSVAAS